MDGSCNLPRRIDALDEMFSFLERQLRPHEIDEHTRFWINLAAEEVFTNMVRHNVVGESDVIRFEVEITDASVKLRLVDADVEPWDPATTPAVDPSLPAEAREPGGLGVHLVKSSVDELSYEYEDREMRVTVVKNRVH